MRMDSSKSQRPALAKISCPSVMVFRGTWIKARWFSMESVHWSKLKDIRCSCWIPTKVWTRGDKKHDILSWDRYQFNLISLDVSFCRDHRDKIEVPDPLAVEDLISYKLNNGRKLARWITREFIIWKGCLEVSPSVLISISIFYFLFSISIFLFYFPLTTHKDKTKNK